MDMYWPCSQLSKEKRKERHCVKRREKERLLLVGQQAYLNWQLGGQKKRVNNCRVCVCALISLKREREK